MKIDGDTRIIAHIGYPTSSFKAPLIYNPFFASIGLNAAVVPMGVTRENGAVTIPAIVRMTNVMGALITMPHKLAVVDMLDVISPAVRVAGACNAVRYNPDGTLAGDMFDGEGFALGMLRKGREIAGRSALIVGSGGVGSAIAAALAARGLGRLRLFDTNAQTMEALAARLTATYPMLPIEVGTADPQDCDIVVNATPLGMNDGDPMPMDISRIPPEAFVGEVVMKRETTAFLAAAAARGCQAQVGVDMLFEMIPAYLDFFGLPAATPEQLRALAQITY